MKDIKALVQLGADINVENDLHETVVEYYAKRIENPFLVIFLIGEVMRRNLINYWTHPENLKLVELIKTRYTGTGKILQGDYWYKLEKDCNEEILE